MTRALYAVLVALALLGGAAGGQYNRHHTPTQTSWQQGGTPR